MMSLKEMVNKAENYKIPDFGKIIKRLFYAVVFVLVVAITYFVGSKFFIDEKEPDQNLMELQIQELLINQAKFRESILILTLENIELQREILEAKKRFKSSDKKLIGKINTSEKELEKRKMELLRIKKLINE